MDLKVIDGKVNYLMKAGKDTVKSIMDYKSAEKIIAAGKMTTSRKYKGFNICVDDKYFFESVKAANKEDKKSD